jgi:hypothetical protein
MLEKLKYPIGHYTKPNEFTREIIEGYIQVIEFFPQKISRETIHLTRDKLDDTYRPEGWTLRQLVNHCADSHMNAYMRFKFALTEDKPEIKPYPEAIWAELPDSLEISIEPALKIISGVHERWAFLLRKLDDKNWKRGYYHPEKGRVIPLDEAAGMYAWHCEHHLAHITSFKKRMRWE